LIVDILKTLAQVNPWWNRGHVDAEQLPALHRDEFQRIRDHLAEKRILALVGPRRVGKSTLMYQTIQSLLDDGIAPKRILFFSGDDPTLFSEKATIDDVLTAYDEGFLHGLAQKTNEPVYLFIDEIQALTDWQLHLKKYHDLRYRMKAVVSGSSSTLLFRGSRESLMGRIEEIPVGPLSFRQYLRFHTHLHPEGRMEGFLDALPRTVLWEDPVGYFDELHRARLVLEPYRPYVQSALQEYLVRGGYPESFETVSPALWQRRLLQDIVERAIFRDIVGVYGIRNPEKLANLMYFIAANQGGAPSLNTIAQHLDMDRETVSSYVQYLKDACLVTELPCYSSSIPKTLRRNRKLYIDDNGIVCSFLRTTECSPELAGLLVENVVLQKAKAYCLEEVAKVFYWSGDKEVDLVMERGGDRLPVEVKFRNQIKASDYAGIEAFQKQNATRAGLVITKDRLERLGDVVLIPYWSIA
jgi:predicted AAA+ superfamily ATPase